MNEAEPQQLNEIRYSRNVRQFGAIAAAASTSIPIAILLFATLPGAHSGKHAALVFLVAAAAVVPLALTLAEMSSLGSRQSDQHSSRFRAPDAIIFLRDWVLVGGLLATAALFARGCAIFLSALTFDLLHIQVSPTWIIPAIVLLIIGNDILGAHVHRTIENLLAILLIGMVLALAISGAALGWRIQLLPVGTASRLTPYAVALAAGVFWSLVFILVSAGDIRDPARNGPGATLLALPLITGVCAAGAMAAPFFVMLAANDLDGLSLLVRGTIWEQLVPAVSLVTAAAFLAALNRAILATTFVASDMSRCGFLPAQWRHPHPSLFTPYRLLIGVGAATTFASTLFDGSHLLTVVSLTFMAAAVVVNLPAIAGRSTASGEKQAFLLPFAPLIPAVAIFVALFLLTTFPRLYLLGGAAWLAIGALGYVFYGRHGAAQAVEEVTVFRSETDHRASVDYRVLVPISNPATAPSLLRTASRMARAQNGEVIALHAVVVPPQTTLASGRRLGRLRWQVLEQAIATAKAMEAPIHSLVRIAHSPVQAILDTAAEEDCDLILLGWTGVSDRGSAVGPVIDEVVNLAGCDVALLRGDPDEKGPHILIPTAGGPHAPAALRLGTQFAGTMGGDVTILTFVVGELTESARETAQQRLDSTLSKAQTDFPVKTNVLSTDDIQQALLDSARDFDLVLLGASQEGPLNQIVFGGLPEAIARRSPTPVVLVRRHRTLPQLWLHRVWLRLNALLPSLTREEVIDVYRSVRRDSRPDVDFFVLILLSAVIATFGLLQSSAAVIIGAMLVAPLMTPILGISMGLVRGDVRLLRLAAESALKGIFLAILVALGVVLLTPGADVTPEILARTHPTLLDLFVALASGAAGAYAIGRKDVAAALPGVAIAAALLPPLAVGGIGIALAQADVTAGALLLFCTNLLAITLAGAIVFLLLGLRPEPDEEDRQRRLWQGMFATVVLVVAVSIPLGWFLVSGVQEQQQQTKIHQVLTETGYSFHADLVDFVVEPAADPSTLDVFAIYYAEEPPPKSLVASTEAALSQAIDASVALEVRVIPISIIPGGH